MPYIDTLFQNVALNIEAVSKQMNLTQADILSYFIRRGVDFSSSLAGIPIVYALPVVLDDDARAVFRDRESISRRVESSDEGMLHRIERAVVEVVEVNETKARCALVKEKNTALSAFITPQEVLKAKLSEALYKVSIANDWICAGRILFELFPDAGCITKKYADTLPQATKEALVSEHNIDKEADAKFIAFIAYFLVTRGADINAELPVCLGVTKPLLYKAASFYNSSPIHSHNEVFQYFVGMPGINLSGLKGYIDDLRHDIGNFGNPCSESAERRLEGMNTQLTGLEQIYRSAEEGQLSATYAAASKDFREIINQVNQGEQGSSSILAEVETQADVSQALGAGSPNDTIGAQAIEVPVVGENDHSSCCCIIQ
jgi:hypothetical protein